MISLSSLPISSLAIQKSIQASLSPGERKDPLVIAMSVQVVICSVVGCEKQPGTQMDLYFYSADSPLQPAPVGLL